MITAPLHASPELQWPTQANLVSRDLQPSSGERCGRQRVCALQGATANRFRKWQRLASQVLPWSQLHQVDSDDTNGCAGFAVDQITANLADLANSVVLCLTFGSRFVTTLSAIGKAGHDGESLRHGLHAGDKGCGFWAHEKIPSFDWFNIGPMALPSQEVISVYVKALARRNGEAA